MHGDETGREQSERQMSVFYKRAAIRLILIFGIWLAGCMPDVWAGCEPTWWDNPHQHDEWHLYFKAKGESAVSEQEAWNNALSGVRKLVAEYIQTSVAMDSLYGNISNRFDLHEIEVRDDPVCRSTLGQWTVYMLARYPRSEYDKIREKIELADQLHRDWAAAQSALNQDDLTQADSLLKKIIAGYDQALSPLFAIEDVKLKLAGLYLKQNPPSVLEARKWIQDVLKSTSKTEWRQQAEEMGRTLPPITLHDAFGNRKVGLFCCIRDAQPARLSPELLEEAAARLAGSSVATVRLIPKDVAQAADLFNAGSAAPLIASAKAAGAEAVLAILLVVDPAQTGQKVDVFDGVQREAWDATVYYMVLRVLDGQLVCADKTLGCSHFGAKSLLNPVFAHRNHLPKYAPTIAESL
jgi:hypothetical protein